MQTIYIDVTNVLTVPFLTGIQRVVSKVLCAFQEETVGRIIFLRFSARQHGYTIVPTQELYQFLNRGKKPDNDHMDLYSKTGIHEMKPGDIFFDIDSVWNNIHARRSYVYPELKSQGVRIAVFVHDVIPVTHHQYSHQNTVYNFLDYAGAFLQYADLIITSVRNTQNQIDILYKKLGLEGHALRAVSWLGADLIQADSGNKSDSELINGNDIRIPETVKIATAKPFILAVGTIEPRKNHVCLLNAFERHLANENLNLVFAGRIGWNVEALAQRIESVQKNEDGFFFFESPDDTVIQYLYKNALFVAFPSFEEGFGLPVVEALQHGTPVLASDIPVLREVGGEYCDYFDPADPDSLSEKVRYYLSHPDAYEKLKQKVATFEPFTWKQCAEKMENALQMLSATERDANSSVKQIVFLTSRVESIRKTLPFVDHLMSFIEEAVLCCPDHVKHQMEQCYQGRLKVTVLTDDELLSGRDLPDDHGTRNFLLRCMMMEHPGIDDVFIMSDDDYRPLRPIDKAFFVNDNVYNAYYFYDIRKWNGTVGHMQSYDMLHFHTRTFLLDHQYPTRQYSSHMPQIIDKAVFMEMLQAHEGLAYQSVDEWSSYFNYAQYHYPHLINSLPYATLAWPASGTDWDQQIYQQDFAFENYYDALYKDGEIFDGFSETYYDEIVDENKKKISIYQKLLNTYTSVQNKYRIYEQRYTEKYGYCPSFVIFKEDEHVRICLPGELRLCSGIHIKLNMTIMIDEPDYEMNWEIHNPSGTLEVKGVSFDGLFQLDKNDLKLTGYQYELPVDIPKRLFPGKYVFRIIVNHKEDSWSEDTVLILER